MKKTKKALVLVLALVLVCGASVMGTMAYLTHTTGVVTNTFTVGNVNITLDEKDLSENAKDGDRTSEGNEYHLIPGTEYVKDPTVHVTTGSEDCYVFVKVENGLSAIEDDVKIADQLTADGNWVLVDQLKNIYRYKDVMNDTDKKDAVAFSTFTVSNGLSNEDIKAYANAEIKVTACAVQAEGMDSVGDAFAALPAEFTDATPAE